LRTPSEATDPPAASYRVNPFSRQADLMANWLRNGSSRLAQGAALRNN
jgi:hypothetical protein